MKWHKKHWQQQDLVNVASSTPVQPPGTLFHPTFTTLLIRVHSENNSRMYFLIVLISDYCRCSWTCRIAAPNKSCIDWLIDWHNNRTGEFLPLLLHTAPASIKINNFTLPSTSYSLHDYYQILQNQYCQKNLLSITAVKCKRWIHLMLHKLNSILLYL